MSTADILKILPLLSDSELREEALNLLSVRLFAPAITNYRGMWKPKPRSTLSRAETIQELRRFRNAWETVTRRGMDMSDERLASETTPSLRRWLQHFYTEQRRRQAESWLRNQ